VHPILTRPGRLALYLATWLVLCVPLVAAFRPRHADVAGARVFDPAEWIGMLVFWGPVILVYAFICLSAWYVCRARPVTGDGIYPMLASSLVAAAMASGAGSAVASGWQTLLVRTGGFLPTPVASAVLPVFAMGVLLYLLSLAVHYVLLALEAARDAERRRLELEVLSRDAELRALRAQIDPHFLYNSLNSISALTTRDSGAARDMCVLLGNFLRDTVRVGQRTQIELGDELMLADRFLTIEQARFGHRLRVERHVDETAAPCAVPPLLLQPLLENAVTHGIARLLEGGLIRLHVTHDDQRLSIAIENSRDADAPTTRGHGVGLDNVRRRLQTMFGHRARISTRAEPDTFRVELQLPWAPVEE
jgi:sensor histidine kinase YesM